MKNLIVGSSQGILLGLLALGLVLAPQAAFAGHFWTAVGSTGIVDEDSLGDYAMVGFAFSYNPNSSSLNKITARYNVTETFRLAGIGDNPGWSALEMRSNAPFASVAHAQLVRVNPLNGTTAGICAVDNAGNGTRVLTCALHEAIDFANFAYFITVTLSRTQTTVVPTVGTLRMY